MYKHTPGRWVGTSGQVFLGSLPLAGFLVDLVDNVYFKQYLADFLVAVVKAVGSALIDNILDAIFYTAG